MSKIPAASNCHGGVWPSPQIRHVVVSVGGGAFLGNEVIAATGPGCLPKGSQLEKLGFMLRFLLGCAVKCCGAEPKLRHASKRNEVAGAAGCFVLLLERAGPMTEPTCVRLPRC